jgi:hypothetical protein
MNGRERRRARKFLNVFAVGFSMLAVGWFMSRMPDTVPAQNCWPWVMVAGGVIWLGLFLAWRHGRAGSAGVLARWTRRSQRNRGVASFWSILRHASGWAMRAKARVLRPSLRLHHWIRPLDVATPLARVGWLRVWSACEDVTVRVGGPRTGKSGELMLQDPGRARRRDRHVHEDGPVPALCPGPPPGRTGVGIQPLRCRWVAVLGGVQSAGRLRAAQDRLAASG